MILPRAAAGLRDVRARLVGRRGALILLYHRIAEPEQDPWRLCVSPQSFAAQLAWLRRTHDVVPLGDLVDALARGRSLRRMVVVTFDDGYRDNLLAAKPILERFAVPATVFVATGAIGSSREFWWDELERIFLLPGTLPERLELELGRRVRSWHLGPLAEYGPALARAHAAWRGWDAPPTPRHVVFQELWQALRALGAGERRAVMDGLCDWAGVARTARPSHRALDLAGLRTLLDGDLIELGAHTVSHPLLPARPLAEQRREIAASRAFCETVLGRRPAGFTYPYGGHASETVSAVRDEGFAMACTTVPDSVRPGDADRHLLPRLTVTDRGHAAFVRQVARGF